MMPIEEKLTKIFIDINLEDLVPSLTSTIKTIKLSFEGRLMSMNLTLKPKTI